jgi:hypothetical protein
VRIVKVGLPDGTAWSWRIGDALVDPSGKARASGGAGSSMSDKGNITTSEFYWSYGDVTIRLLQTSASGKPSPGQGMGSDLGLLAAIDAGGWKCSFERKGGSAIPCTLRQDPPLIVKR